MLLRTKLSVFDLVIIIVPVILAVFLLCSQDETHPRAVLIKTPEGLWRYKLPAQRKIQFQGRLGRFEIEIKDFQVEITETHCYDKTCRGMGPLKRVGETMICLPQEIEVLLEGEKSLVDAVCR